VLAAKLYPAGVTTNSSDGVQDITSLYSVFEEMQRVDMVLSIHGELPGAFCLDREDAFLPTLERIATAFPSLRIVLEHITSKRAVEAIRSLRVGVVATITVHHLVLTLDDVVGDLIQPHHFCKPIPKTPADRAALVDAATSGDCRFFLGTDSAPHKNRNKAGDYGAAGVFSAPVALPLLVQCFEQYDQLDRIEAFCSRYGRGFYGLDATSRLITLRREKWTVPKSFGGLTPFWAGKDLSWQIADPPESFIKSWTRG